MIVTNLSFVNNTQSNMRQKTVTAIKIKCVFRILQVDDACLSLQKFHSFKYTDC